MKPMSVAARAVADTGAGRSGAAEDALSQGAAAARGVEVRAARKGTGIDTPRRFAAGGTGQPAVDDAVGEVAGVVPVVGAPPAVEAGLDEEREGVQRLLRVSGHGAVFCAGRVERVARKAFGDDELDFPRAGANGERQGIAPPLVPDPRLEGAVRAGRIHHERKPPLHNARVGREAPSIG